MEAEAPGETFSIEQLIEKLSEDGDISALYTPVDDREVEQIETKESGERVNWRQTAPEILKQFPVQVV